MDQVREPRAAWPREIPPPLASGQIHQHVRQGRVGPEPRQEAGEAVAPRPAAAVALDPDGRGGIVGEGVAPGSDGHDFNHSGSLRRDQGDAAKGAEAWPAQPDGRGGIRLTLDHKTLDRLHSLRGPGERYSDVILRLAAESEL